MNEHTPAPGTWLAVRNGESLAKVDYSLIHATRQVTDVHELRYNLPRPLMERASLVWSAHHEMFLKLRASPDEATMRFLVILLRATLPTLPEARVRAGVNNYTYSLYVDDVKFL